MPDHIHHQNTEEVLENFVVKRKKPLEAAILVLIVLVLFISMLASLRTLRASRHMTSADTIAIQKLQEYRYKTFDELPESQPLNTLLPHEDFSASLPSDLPGPRHGGIFIANLSPTLKEVVSMVSFGSGSNQQTIEHTILIRKPGAGE